MIPAQENRFWNTVWHAYFWWRARKTFHSVWAKGLDTVQSIPPTRSILFFCTHTTWWEGPFAILLTRHLPTRSCYCMMEEKHLRHYRFFTHLGAFSIDLENRRNQVASLRYAQRLLETPRNAVWIFPQGQICPPSQAVEVKPGTQFLAQRAPETWMIPVAMRVEFFREDRPVALIYFGAPVPTSACGETTVLDALNTTMSEVQSRINSQDLTGFTPLLAPQWSLNKRWEWVKRNFTGTLAGFDPEN